MDHIEALIWSPYVTSIQTSYFKQKIQKKKNNIKENTFGFIKPTQWKKSFPF